MSFAANVAWQQMLTARNSDLTFEVNTLSENLLQIQSISTRLVSIGSNILPNSPDSQILQARQSQIALLSKGLEVQLELVKTQQRAVVTELDAIKKTISEDINRDFKLFSS